MRSGRRAILLLLGCAALAAAQDAAPAAATRAGVVGVQARRSFNMRGRDMNMMSRAVGIVIGEDGLVLTANLGERPENVRVFEAGRTEGLDAEVLESDESFSLLRVSGLDTEPVTFRQDWTPRVGDPLTWVGLLPGPLGRWTPVSRASRVDAVIEDGASGVRVYSDPPFNGAIVAACALVRDGEGRAVGAIYVETEAQDEGRPRMGMGGRAPALPFVCPAARFAQYLSGAPGSRGVLGVVGEELAAKVAEAMGLAGTRGVLVTQVTPGSGADRAGIRPQDIVTQVAGAPTPTLPALQEALRAKKAGEIVAVDVVRLGGEKPLPLALEGKLTARETSDPSQRLRARRFGFVAEPLTADQRREQGLTDDVVGLYVRRVTPGGPAALARPTPLRRGDIILKVGDRETKDLDALRAALAAVADGAPASLFVRNQAETRFVEIRPEAGDD